jgi:propionyl-CoA carboxylase alpha chain
VRCDSGITEGSQISIYYDPLISKLVTYGKDRHGAVSRMKEALDSYVIRGVTHNVDFLRTIMENDKFLSGDLSTAFIGQQFPEGFKGHTLSPLQRSQLTAAAAVLRVLNQQRAATISGRLNGAAEPAEAYDRTVLVSVGATAAAVDVEVESKETPSNVTKNMAAGVASRFSVVIQGTSHSVVAALPGSSTIYRCAIDGNDVVLQLLSTDALGYTLQFCGSPFAVQVKSSVQQQLQAHMPAKRVADTSKSLVTPMPGLVANLLVKVGDKVAPGQPLAVIEAMKMQNMLSVGKAFVVKSILVKVGQNVALDDTLITFDSIQ